MTGTAAENGPCQDPPCDGNVAVHAVTRRADHDGVAVAHLHRRQCRNRSAGYGKRRSRSVGCKQNRSAEDAELRASKRKFQCRCVRQVACKRVGQRQRPPIHRSGSRHAEPSKAVASCILNRHSRTALDNLKYGHPSILFATSPPCAASRSRSDHSCAETGRNLTRSPGSKRNSGALPG